MKKINRMILVYTWVVMSIILCGSVFIIWKYNPAKKVPFINYKTFAPPIEPLSKKDIDFLTSVFERLVNRGRSTSVVSINPELFIPLKGEGSGLIKEIPKISLVCVGKSGGFAIINGKIYKKGDRLTDGSVVAMITKKGVALKKDNRIVFLPWIMPTKVMFLGSNKTTSQNIIKGKKSYGKKNIKDIGNILSVVNKPVGSK